VSEPVFIGHMLGQVHGVVWTTNAEVEKDKALAAQIFGGKPSDLTIGECHGQDWCLWVLAIQVVIGLIRGPKWRGFKLWHVYSTGEKSPGSMRC
jgi:hypothetical protein